MVAARVEAIAGLQQISSKEFLRVSWNAAHIAVKATRVFAKMDFRSELRLNSGGVLAMMGISVIWEAPQKSKFVSGIF